MKTLAQRFQLILIISYLVIAGLLFVPGNGLRYVIGGMLLIATMMTMFQDRIISWLSGGKE